MMIYNISVLERAIMKFTIQTILSLPVDGGSSHLLIFDNSIKILLDCGISRRFDFDKYERRAEDLKNVSLVLISHSSLEYSGAIAFLVQQLGLDPKIFYTTQAIMRYSPLNLHEEILNLRCKTYCKKIFNKIYKIYESINIVKPQQKKCVDLSTDEKTEKPQINQPENKKLMEGEQVFEPAIGQVDKHLYFTCYSGGSNMGSLAWRLSYGIVNIMYLVEYTNFSLHHINGLNLQQIMSPIDILVTDTYKNINDSEIKKSYLYQKVKDILIKFYAKNGMTFEKPTGSIPSEAEKKIIFSCYPNEMIVQVMAVVKKVVEDLQPQESRQKIRVIHLSSRFLQLIKSQMDYFSPYFKETLENIQQHFIHEKQITGRISITTFQCIQGLLSNSVNTKPVQIYHFGPQLNFNKLSEIQKKAQQKIMKFKIMSYQEKIIHSASKIDIQSEQQRQEESVEKSEMLSEKQATISEVPDEVQIMRDVQQQVHQPLHSKYFSQVGFPRFTRRQKQDQFIYDDYGCRHQYARFQQRNTIEDYKKDLVLGAGEPQMQKKNSTIQIMNIEFKIPSTTILDYSKIKFIPFHSNRTNFNSSVQLITTLKPDKIILINTDSSGQFSGSKYKHLFKNLQEGKQIEVFDLYPKNYCHIGISNQLISYKVNYIPIPQQRKLQKVKGQITYNSSNGLLYIHLDCLQEKQHLNFRMDKFYKRIVNETTHDCKFTKEGLIIDGVKVYRQQNKIILEGMYSDQYFKVRKLLYQFLKLE